MSVFFRRAYRITFFDKNEKAIAQYAQDAPLTLDESQITGLRIQFRVLQQINLINNIAEIHIFNLNESSRSLLNETAFSLTLEAGYIGNLKQIHTGKIVNIFDNREQPDYIYSVFTLDYLGVLNPISLTLPATMTDRQMIKALGGYLDGCTVQDGNLRGLTDQPVGQKIVLANVMYTQALQKLSDAMTVNFYLTNNILYSSSKETKPPRSPNTTLTILNSKNGMIRSPVIDVAQSGITVKSFLNPQLLPGNYVKVETVNPQIQLGQVNFVNFSQQAATRGEWMILTVEHAGDSRGAGEDWVSTVSGFGYKLLLYGANS